MKLLRDKRELTKLLLLLELSNVRYRTFKTLAEQFDITIQAISDYFKIMTDEGLVHKVDGVYKPTPKGVEFLHYHFTELRNFIDKSMEKLAIISTTTAKAGNKINRGDNVGLFMEHGILTAYKNRKSTSTGTASTSAEKNMDVGISNLEGIVKLKPGTIIIINLPNMEDGGSKSVTQNKLQEKIEKINPDIIALKGITAEIVADKLKINKTVKFGVVESAVDAALHGLKVVILTAEENIPAIKLDFEKLNQELRTKIEYRNLNL
jgi:putative transcriptional regulator